ncbi:MAG TPA: biosynthetic-type acetolactate synthase large subunit [Thermoanaerobaculia bacterium]|nr:biosynthetic-type acetolactate synthase large subunit [Thermoanaerobaculia bacterium]
MNPPSESTGRRVLTGAEIVCECLLREQAHLIFGYPGGAILPTYDALTRYPDIHHVLSRHEQGASHMADGFARATGRVGVVMATSGPGATNLVTGLATAMMDSSPVVAITGQVSTSVIGTDAFQETDVTGVTIPVTKHNYLVPKIEELVPTIHEAFHIARTGRPGPVLVDIPKDVQTAKLEYDPDDVPSIALPGYRPAGEAHESQVRAAVELVNGARRPVILAGHGILMAQATEELRFFAERAEIPVALTLLGKGAISEDHPLCLGMMGMHGGGEVNHAIQEADLLIALGMRFDDRVTGNLETYARKSRKIHVDIDPSEINKNVPVEIGIVGDLKKVLAQLLPHLDRQRSPEWVDQIGRWREDSHRRDIVRARAEEPPGGGDGRLLAAQVIHDLYQATGGDVTTVTDVGQHQMWEAQYFRHHRPHTLITSGGLGTMGFGLPAAIGAKMGAPNEEVWAIVGDGGFQMTMCELATAVQEQVDVNVCIVNNGYLGMVRQWQEFFYEERYNQTPMVSPDFCKIGEAYDIPSHRVTKREEIPGVVEKARACRGPVLIEFVVEKADVVYPMVPTGATLDEMIRRPEQERQRPATQTIDLRTF